MEINKIITKIRFKLNDSNEAKFSDYDIIQAINESYKQFREICMQEVPEFLTVKRSGVVEAETNTIVVTDVAEVIELRTTDRVLKPKRKLPIWNETGEPREYALGRGENGLCLYLYPTPTSDFDYELICVEQIVELTADNTIDLPNELVNCIIDFSVSALAQNPDAYADIDNRVRLILRRYVPHRDFVESYY